jgi:hypothetical protein
MRNAIAWQRLGEPINTRGDTLGSGMASGSTQMVVVDSMPSYKTGDRVRDNKGVV